MALRCALRRITSLLASTCLVAGCATRSPQTAPDLNPGRLPSPNTSVDIAGLGPCTDSTDRTLRFDASQPLNVLVHGCFGSSGQFRGLAQVLAFHGQQSACFTYDDRAKLADSAAALRQALTQLAERSQVAQITVIGHSQGALVARSALTEPAAAPRTGPAAELRLVTVSGPFAGIESARTCGRTWLYPLTLGLLPVSCYLITGAKWADISYSSHFILAPGELSAGVVDYLKIDTDERNTCRRAEAGRCIESDDVFSLAEQQIPTAQSDARMKRVLVKAGHVEIVGDKLVAPTKLLSVLQEQGVLRQTPPEQAAAYRRLLSAVYLDADKP